MPGYRRNRVPGGTYFFTVNLLERHTGLLVKHIDVFRNAVRQVRARRPFHIDAWVVLPDHTHCIWTLPPAIPISLRAGKPSRLPSQRHCQKRSDCPKGERSLWQRWFWEHTIRDERDYAAHVDYVHINLYKHGLVQQVSVWPYSSFHRFVANGVYPDDWAGGTMELAAGEGGA
jgi:putative transposase